MADPQPLGRAMGISEGELRFSWKTLVAERVRPFGGPDALPDAEIRRLARVLGEAGLQGATVPAKLGGGALSGRLLGVMLEELAPAVGFTAFHVAARFLALFGTEEARERYLAPLISGELMGCAAISEPGVGSDAGSIKALARREGDYYVLDGVKSWVWGGSAAHVANTLVVTDPAAGPRGISRMLVDLEGPGVAVRRVEAGGLSVVPMAEVAFDGHRVPVSNRLGAEGEGFRLTLKGLEASRCSVASQAVGIARAATELATGHVRERQQFGRPIGSFQLVQRLIAEMATYTEAAALLTRQGWEAVSLGGRASREASMAKAFAPEAAIRVCNHAVELFGAAGLLDDCPVKRLLGYARGLTFPDGTTEMNQLIVGRELLGISAIA